MRYGFDHKENSGIMVEYGQYKVTFLALLTGILIGVLTNYVVLFFPQHFYGLLLAILGILLLVGYVVSLYPNTIKVDLEFPKEKPLYIGFIYEDAAKTLGQRFFFRANISPNVVFETLFEPTRLEGSMLTDVRPTPQFLSMSRSQCKKKMVELAEKLGLESEDKKKMIEYSETKFSRSISWRIPPTWPFKYRCIGNWFLRGKGVFYIFDSLKKIQLGCLIMPSVFCNFNRDSERYHATLYHDLNEIMISLMEDPIFKEKLKI